MTSKLTRVLAGLGLLAQLAACDRPAAPPAQQAAPATPAATAPTPQAAVAVPPPAVVAPQPAPAAPAAAQQVQAAAPAKAVNTHSLAAGVALAPAPKATPLAAPAARAAEGKQAVNLVGAVASLPADWQSTRPANPMRVAQYTTPPAKNGEVAELVVFFFAAGRGGSQEDNIGRWKSQFSAPGGAPVEPKLAKGMLGAMPVTRVELAGNYARGVGMSSTDAAKPDQVLLAAIVTTPAQGNLTLHFYGHKDAVGQYRAAFEDILASLKPSGH